MTAKLKQAIVLVNFSDISEVILKIKCDSRGDDTKRRRRSEKKNYLFILWLRLVITWCLV